MIGFFVTPLPLEETRTDRRHARRGGQTNLQSQRGSLPRSVVAYHPRVTIEIGIEPSLIVKPRDATSWSSRVLDVQLMFAVGPQLEGYGLVFQRRLTVAGS